MFVNIITTFPSQSLQERAVYLQRYFTFDLKTQAQVQEAKASKRSDCKISKRIK